MVDANTPEPAPPAPPFSASGRDGAKRRPWSFLLKFAISAGLIIWIASSADLDAVWSAMVGVDLRWLAFASVLNVLGAAIISVRWGGLLAVRDVRPGFRYLFASTLCSAFFRQFLPSIVGGDAIRGYDAWRAGASPGFAVVSLVVDRLLGLATLAIFALLAIALLGDLSSELSSMWVWIALGLAIFAGVIGFTALPDIAPPAFVTRLVEKAPAKLTGLVAKIFNSLRAFRDGRAALGRGFALSVLLQVNVVTFYWAISQALGLGLDYSVFYVIAPLAIFVMMAPITVNGVGLREAVFIALLALWGVDGSVALAFAWLEYGVMLAFGLFGGGVYALRRS